MESDLSKAAAALGKKGGQSKSENKIATSRVNGAKGGRPSRPMFEISVRTNAGEKCASVRHVASDCGADFYQSGEELDWQDNNGLLANCAPGIIEKARRAAEKALA